MSSSAHPTDPTRWAEIKQVFEAAFELPREERAAYLDRACRTAAGEEDAELRAAVESLLGAEDEWGERTGEGRFLDAPPAGHVLSDLGAKLIEPPPEAGPELEPGDRIGPYEVERLLGRGGMGEVYLAERVDGLFRRTVALKRVRAGLAPGLAERFVDERQILAGLVHPGIARLYAAGEDETGRPWLAMEPIEGVPLPDYAEGRDERARVGLLIQACEAVQHAHQRLVVHRDIKPSNVLVTKEGRVVLLDFGIAQVLGGEEELKLLTRSYASPEQLEGEAATTASDVYSLGVLLVRTLTGSRPEGPGDVDGLTGDLADIARRALAEDPSGRYNSAAALADDLRRWLDGHPVQARPQTAGYLFRRFVGRHRIGVVGVGLLTLSILAGLAATTWQAREARRAAAESDATAEFLASLFQGADPTVAGDSLLALELLQQGAERIERNLADQPAVRAQLYHVIGEAYLGLGRADSAIAFAQRARRAREPGGAAPDPVAAVRARVLLGRSLFPVDPEASDRELAAAVTEARATGDAPVLLDALEAHGTLAGSQVLTPTETVAVMEEAAALAEKLEGEDSLRRGRLLAALAMRMGSAHRYDKMEPLLRDALARLPVETAAYDRAKVLLDLASLLHATGNVDEALVHVNESLAIHRRLFGDDDARTAQALSDRAFINDADPVAAERDVREALRVTRRARDRAIEVDLLNALGKALEGQGRHDEAVEAFRQRLTLVGEVFGTDGTRYAAGSGNIARALDAAGRYAEAARAWETSIRLTTEAYGPESAVVASTLLAASHTAERAGRPAQALALVEEAHRASRGLDSTSATKAMASLYLGRRLLDAGRAQDALAPLREATESRAAFERTSHRDLDGVSGAEADVLLGEALVALGRKEEGRRWLTRTIPVLADERGADDPLVRRARAALDRSR